MRYKTLGDTGVLVSRLCLGTMTFGGAKGIWKTMDSCATGKGEDASLEISEGGKTRAWLATLPADGPSGGFFHLDKPVPS
jgi:hypothetical protein